ncbi:MAG: Calcineurin-like phosphoesterase superfamily domain protein [Chlamydiales bacterium]|nr:Calcineurin-like phosphoesterase superfamily domain protein [Chlamydiales bacterium]
MNIYPSANQYFSTLENKSTKPTFANISSRQSSLEAKAEQQWQGRFTFIQMADCQLGFISPDGWSEDMKLLEKTVIEINKFAPRFVILCGDMTHARPNEINYERQVTDYKRIVSEINPRIPLLCLCGNHDVGDRPTVESIATYERNFGPQYFSFWAGGVHCTSLNSSLLVDPSAAPELAKAQDLWFKEEMIQSSHHSPKLRLIFTHHSWFLTDPMEKDSHFAIPKKTRLKWLEQFEQYGVTACFAGHYHRNASGKYENIEMITTSAIGRPLGTDPSGFRLVEVSEGSIQHTYYPIE